MRWILVLGLLLLAAVPRAVAAQATGQVSGTVTGTNGRPLVGASVSVAGTGRGVQSGADGRFTITAVPVGSRTLRATFAGYSEASQSVTVVAGQTATANIQLTATAVRLEEVVAIGYGTTRRRDVTGAIASVGAEELATKATPTATLSTALQGRAPGVQVVSNSGAPGGGASVRIRGTNSITANSEPLYIVDGVPAAQGSTGTDNPLNSIDPNNIESVEILKDASATAIYGARGANGVVLVTTKRGQRGSSQLQLESSYGIQNLDKKIPMMNSQEWMTMANLANQNAGIAPRYTPAQIAAAQTYDHVDELIRSAPQQSHAVTFSGGDAQTRFLVSGNYLGQQGLIVNSDFARYGGRVNLDRSMSERFRISANLSGTNAIQSGTQEGAFFGIRPAMEFDPSLPPKDTLGNWTKIMQTSDFVEYPVATQHLVQTSNRTTRILTSFNAEYDLLDGLRLRTVLGGNLTYVNNPFFEPRTSPRGGEAGIARRTWGESRELTGNSTLSYNREIGPGTLDALGAFEIQTSNTESTISESRNFPTDALGYDALQTGALLIAPITARTDWAIVSGLARVNYNLLDRYLFTVTGRRDGSSRFGENSKYAFFPSAAFAWRVVDEPFMQNQALFTDLKFRVSYGRTGNQGVQPYQSLAQLSGVPAVFESGLLTAFVPANAAGNPNLKWETQDQVNAGLDLGFLDNRLTISADVYRTNTSDLLLNVTLPNYTGYATQLQNVGSVRNEGLELSINTVNFEGDRFTWRSNLNVSTNRNQVTSLFGGLESLPNPGSFITKVGQPLSTVFGYKVEGLYQQGDACNLDNKNECQPGEFKIQDLDANRVINDNDRVILGHADPDLYGGFTNNLTFGPLSLDAFVNYSIGNEILNTTATRTTLVKGVFNERRSVLDYWTPTNTNTTTPRPNAARVNRNYSILLEDGTFFRLQTLTLGYRVPQRLRPFASEARLFVAGQNVWLWSDYSGFDPEVNTGGGAAQARGEDNSGYPRGRIWNAGVSLTF
jgi:TonB-dependent starch-binding outer membrane protein SusC